MDLKPALYAELTRRGYGRRQLQVRHAQAVGGAAADGGGVALRVGTLAQATVAVACLRSRGLMTEQARHPLYGVRLGKMERWLLLEAPSPETLGGFKIDDPDAQIREQLRRATVKLEGVGLVERLRMQVYVRARDPRREGVVYKNHAFWLREDQSRAHRVRRNVVWRTPFGEQILLRYGPQLSGGGSIRWDAQTVWRAFDLARPKHFQHRSIHIAALEDDARDEVVLAGPVRGGLKLYHPPEVRTEMDLERWKLAAEVAGHRHPKGRSDELLGLANDLYKSGIDVLRSEHAAIPRPAKTASQRFRHKYRPAL